MLRLKSHLSPQRYWFKDPDTGREFTGANMKALVTQIISYREQNRLPLIQYLKEVIENFLCLQPENAGKCEPLPLKRGFWASVKGGIALLEYVFLDRTVSAEVAEERATICRSCPLNVFPDKHGYVKWSDDLAEATVGEKKTIHHKFLGNCDGCSCPLKTKVWYAGKIRLSSEQKKTIKEANPKCWQLKENNKETDNGE